MELRERIRQAGLEVGFDQVGFAPADRPVHADAYLEWLEKGWHGEMAYMAREEAVLRRLSPLEALDGCRSLIVVSLSYAPASSGELPAAGSEAAAGRSLPVVARYAAGRDYHDVFEERLGALAGRVGELCPDARSKPYVDYGPVLERDHAQRAGLGWVGKNTLLIHPRLGSWLLLGELLTTVELEPDAPFVADHCGTCTRCIEACPTGAIRGARQLDARLCISYLTIELRGPIPEELRSLIGDRVFGCDICQEVCPWNDDAVSPGTTADELRPGGPLAPDTMRAWAEEMVAMSDEEFGERYRGTALRRPGREGMLRNLCVGLGNSGDAASRGVLKRCLEDPSPLVREHAAWALSRVREPVRGPSR
jgi:epoxyqueuosine reductase